MGKGGNRLANNLKTLQASHLKVVKIFKLILNDISFSLHRGQVLILKGHNGAGKTTLLRLLAGLCRPNVGELRFNDHGNVYQQREEYSQNIAYLGHKNALKEELTLEENLLCQAIAQEDINEALCYFDMQELKKRKIRYFSAGQKRRAALTRVMASKRILWLLDEPLVGLDDTSRQQLHKVFRQHQKDGGMIIVSSHDPLDLKNAALLELEKGCVKNFLPSMAECYDHV